MIKAVVFDCYGVLYNDAFKEFFAAHRQQLGDKIGYFQELSVKADAGLIAEQTLCDELAQATGESSAEIFKAFTDVTKFNQPVADIVRHLRPHYKLGMLSNAERSLLQPFLDEHQVESLFDVVLASSEIGITKPDPRSFAAIAARLKTDMGEMVFIDDSITHVNAANALGIRGVLYTSAPQLKQDLQQILPVF